METYQMDITILNICRLPENSNLLQQLCISQFQLRPAPPPLIPRGGDEKRGQMPRPPSTLQHFLVIAQSSSAILSILMCDFLFQLTSSFVIVLF